MDNAAIADVLDRAANLIEPEGAWTQGAYSRDQNGNASGDRVAVGKQVCWCAMGALGKVSCKGHFRVYEYGTVTRKACEILEHVIGDDDIPEWNDAPSRTQTEVVAAFREAARLSRNEAEKG